MIGKRARTTSLQEVHRRARGEGRVRTMRRIVGEDIVKHAIVRTSACAPRERAFKWALEEEGRGTALLMSVSI